MEKYILVLLVAIVSINCNGQVDKNQSDNRKEIQDSLSKSPKGSWQVNREYDERGNLVKYDSIYMWSSVGGDNLSKLDKDSLLNSLKTRFYSNFSAFKDNGFNSILSRDSLFIQQHFNDDFFKSDFGKEFMNIDAITQQIIERQRKFLEKYKADMGKSQKRQKQE